MQIWPLVIRSRILYSKIFTKSNIFHEGKLVYPRASRHDIGQRRFCLFSGHKNSSYTATSSPIASPSFKGWMRGKSRCIRNMQGNNCNWFHRVWLLNENRCCAYTWISTLRDFIFRKFSTKRIYPFFSFPVFLPLEILPRKGNFYRCHGYPSLVNVYLHVSACNQIFNQRPRIARVLDFIFSFLADFWKNYLIPIYVIEFSLTDVTHKGRAIFMRFIIVEEKNWMIIPTCIFRLWSGM